MMGECLGRGAGVDGLSYWGMGIWLLQCRNEMSKIFRLLGMKEFCFCQFYARMVDWRAIPGSPSETSNPSPAIAAVLCTFSLVIFPRMATCMFARFIGEHSIFIALGCVFCYRCIYPYVLTCRLGMLFTSTIPAIPSSSLDISSRTALKSWQVGVLMVAFGTFTNHGPSTRLPYLSNRQYQGEWRRVAFTHRCCSRFYRYFPL